MANPEEKGNVCELNVEGMDCATCAGKVEKGLKILEGVKDVKVSIGAERATIVYDRKTISVGDLKKRIRQLGYKTWEAGLADARQEEQLEAEERKKRTFDLIRIGFVGAAILLSFSRILDPFLPFDIALVAIFLGGLPVFQEGYRSLLARDITVETFMSIAILGATIIGEFVAATVIVFFMLIADIIEELTVDRARTAIKDLVKLSPSDTVIERDGWEVTVPIEEVRPRDIVIVRPGQTVPVDGIVLSGQGTVNQAAITGEPLPVEKFVNDHVYAGTLNELGALRIEAHRVGAETTLSKIVQLVEQAETAKAPIQRIADRFSTFFTPVVLSLAFLTWIVTGNVLYAIAAIVVACPCSIALATPLSVVAGSGKAARRGIIIKGGRYLEALAKIDTVVMDKTGTVTVGEPSVVDILPLGGNAEAYVLELAASAEKYSEHSLAKAILKKARERGIEVLDPQDFWVVPGKGVIAVADGVRITLGTSQLLAEEGIEVPSEAKEYVRLREEQANTVMLAACDGKICGAIAVSDVVRETTVEAIREIKRLGIKRLIMLTGDNRQAAAEIAGQIGIDEYYAELLPEEKVGKVKELMNEGWKVAMIGDGINDAPVLALADVGIAMGTAGTDVAIEAADVALMRDDWRQIPEVIRIGRSTFSTIRQNIGIGLVFNIVGVSLAATGILTPVAAAVAHVLPDVGVLFNSSRLFGLNGRRRKPA